MGAPFLHYEVTVYRAQQKSVRLRAVLSPVDEIELPWRALRDRNCWTPGWSSVVENEP